MTRHVILEDQDGPLAWIDDDRPAVSDHFRAYVFGALVITVVAIALWLELAW